MFDYWIGEQLDQVSLDSHFWMLRYDSEKMGKFVILGGDILYKLPRVNRLKNLILQKSDEIEICYLQGSRRVSKRGRRVH